MTAVGRRSRSLVGLQAELESWRCDGALPGVAQVLLGKLVFVAYPAAFDFSLVLVFAAVCRREPFGIRRSISGPTPAAMLCNSTSLRQAPMPAAWFDPLAHTHVALTMRSSRALFPTCCAPT